MMGLCCTFSTRIGSLKSGPLRIQPTSKGCPSVITCPLRGGCSSFPGLFYPILPQWLRRFRTRLQLSDVHIPPESSLPDRNENLAESVEVESLRLKALERGISQDAEPRPSEQSVSMGQDRGQGATLLPLILADSGNKEEG